MRLEEDQRLREQQQALNERQQVEVGRSNRADEAIRGRQIDGDRGAPARDPGRRRKRNRRAPQENGDSGTICDDFGGWIPTTRRWRVEGEQAIRLKAISPSELASQYGPSELAMSLGAPASLAETGETTGYLKNPSAVEQNQIESQRLRAQGLEDTMTRAGITDARTREALKLQIEAANWRYLNTPTQITDLTSPGGAAYATRGEVIGSAPGGQGAPASSMSPSPYQPTPSGGLAPDFAAPTQGTTPQQRPPAGGGGGASPAGGAAPGGAGGTGRLSPAPVSPLRQQLVANDIGEAQLAELKQLFDAGASEWIGPGAGRAEYAKQLIPGVALNEQDKAFADFQTKTATFRNSVLKALGGVVIPPQEHARIVEQIPTTYDKKEVWASKYQASIDNLRLLRELLAQQPARPQGAGTGAEATQDLDSLLDQYSGGR